MSIATFIRQSGGAGGIARNRDIQPVHAGAIHQAFRQIRQPLFAATPRKRASLLPRMAVMLALAGMPLVASAAYKCMGPDGHYVYQDLRCSETATTAVQPAQAAAPAPAPAPAAPAAQTTSTAPAAQAGSTAPAAPATAATTAAAAPATVAAAKPEPYLGDDQDTADPDAAMADDGSDTTEYDDAGGDASQADDMDSAAAKASLGAIFARVALKGVIWLVLAGLVGYRATQRNRGFFKWAAMALILSPALIYLLLRLLGPADEMA